MKPLFSLFALVCSLSCLSTAAAETLSEKILYKTIEADLAGKATCLNGELLTTVKTLEEKGVSADQIQKTIQIKTIYDDISDLKTYPNDSRNRCTHYLERNDSAGFAACAERRYNMSSISISFEATTAKEKIVMVQSASIETVLDLKKSESQELSHEVTEQNCSSVRTSLTIIRL